MQETMGVTVTVRSARLEKRNDDGVLTEVRVYDGATDVWKILSPGDAGFLSEV